MPESSVDDPEDGRDQAEAPAARPALIMGQPDTASIYQPTPTILPLPCSWLLLSVGATAITAMLDLWDFAIFELGRFCFLSSI